MKKMDFPIYTVLVVLSGFWAFPAFAQSVPNEETQPPKTTKKAEIAVDETAGVVRILIDGKPVVIIDSSGIQVFGDVKFTGKTTDNGGVLGKDSGDAQ